MQKKDILGFLVILGLLVSVSSAGVLGQGAMKEKSLYRSARGQSGDHSGRRRVRRARRGRQAHQRLFRENRVRPGAAEDLQDAPGESNL